MQFNSFIKFHNFLTRYYSPGIDWSSQPLPLLKREKLYSQAKIVDEKIAKKNERLHRFKDDFANTSEYLSTNSVSQALFLDQSMSISSPKKEYATNQGSSFKSDYSKVCQLIKIPDDLSIEEMSKKNKIVGTCTNLEKPYFRLGADPDPAKVRPESVLNQSLKMLKNKWKNKEVEYRYMEEQFKSIRQDLVVQGIK